MTIYLGADHRGFALKEKIKSALAEKPEYTVIDCGNGLYDKDDDYPDFAATVAKKVSENPVENRGIVLCGSGVGVCIVANKMRGVRAALGFDKKQIYYARSDDDVNVLALASDYTDDQTTHEIVETFLKTPASDEVRHRRRQKKIEKLEE